ncbi:MAG: hypothetical protein AAF710_02710 [Planctomycetota bacterium]
MTHRLRCLGLVMTLAFWPAWSCPVAWADHAAGPSCGPVACCGPACCCAGESPEHHPAPRPPATPPAAPDQAPLLMGVLLPGVAIEIESTAPGVRPWAASRHGPSASDAPLPRLCRWLN